MRTCPDFFDWVCVCLIAFACVGSCPDSGWAGAVQAGVSNDQETMNLVRQLDDKDPLVHFLAFSRLQELGPKAAAVVPALLDRAKKRRDRESIVILGSIGASSKDAVPFLETLLKERIQGGPEPLEQAYGDSRFGPWTTALTALGGIGPEAKTCVPLLCKLLEDPLPTVRADVAYALGGIGPGAAEAVPALIRAMNDRQKTQWSRLEVRRLAIVAIGDIGVNAEGAVPKLIENLKDNDISVIHDSITAPCAANDIVISYAAEHKSAS